MKLKVKSIAIVMTLVLCMLMQGCKKADTEAVKTEKEKESTACTVTSQPEKESSNTNAAKEEIVETNKEAESGEVKMIKTESWEQVKEINPADKHIRSRYAGFYNDNFGIITFQYGILYYTVDGGETWKVGKNKSDCIAGLEIIDEKNAIISANYSEVRISEDGGANWTEVPNFGDMANEHCRYLSFIDKNTGWIANRKEIGYTTDGGQSWVSVNAPQNISDISAIWLSSTTEGYVLSSDGKFFSTLDGGKTWMDKDLGIKGLQILVCPTAALRVENQQSFQIIAYLENGDQKGYYYLTTKDGGASWEKNELFAEGGPGFVYWNRENSLLTLSEQKDKIIRVFQKIE